MKKPQDTKNGLVGKTISNQLGICSIKQGGGEKVSSPARLLFVGRGGGGLDGRDENKNKNLVRDAGLS